MFEVIKIAVICILLVILFIQARSDFFSMQLYYWLTLIGIALGIVPAIKVIDVSDIGYVILTILLIVVQGLLGAYAWGDAKLYLLCLMIVTYMYDDIDIVIYFFYLEIWSLIIFLLMVFLMKFIIRREFNRSEEIKKLDEDKGQRHYPLAPGIFMATVIIIIVGLY